MHLVFDPFSVPEAGAHVISTNLTEEALVIGIGPELRGDDSAGPMAVDRWRRQHAVGPTRAICLEAPGLDLLDELEGVGVVVLVDAVRSGAPSGTLHVISLDTLQAFASDSRSAHGWGVGETLALAQAVSPERLPAALRIIGIEAGSVQVGESLSPAVEARLDEACDLIDACLCRQPLTVTAATA
jgi:hydrogenase maturation protease